MGFILKTFNHYFPSTTQKLRGYDAVHIACALHYNEILLQNNLSPLIFVTADSEQLQAAQAEGLVTENPNQQV